MTSRVSLLFVAATMLFLSPSPAHAGACPTCQTSAECTAFPGSFCVLWDRDFGCGALRQSCCPGQACALDGNGQPSCLGNGCVIVDDSDGGLADVGASDVSVGDTGVVGDDASTTPNDGGNGGDGAPAMTDASPRDVGTSTTPGGGNGGTIRERPSGCSCDALPGHHASLAVFLFAAASFAWRWRRKRR